MPQAMRRPFAIAAPWRVALPATALLLAAVLWLYRDTAVAMVSIWSRSDTFAHAFLVPPIAAWLVWRERAELARLSPAPTAWMLVPLALAGSLWLLGELGGVNAAAQLALVALLVGVVLAVIGLKASRPIWFALGFLFFAVPFGEFLLPQLMAWTADFTIMALRLSGVPVYRDGLQFVIPSGNWSVVEACSGVRYLIASVMVGTLYAYLNYRSTRRKLVFIGFSFVVPIVANWVRAYLIVMLGHLSNNKLAAGVDHLVYGWVFFGVVMFAMFVIGARWAETAEAGGLNIGVAAAAPAGLSARWLWPVFAGAVIVLALPPWVASAVDQPASDTAAVRLNLPAPAPGWQPAAAGLALTPAFEHASTTYERTYARGGRSVTLYIAYYHHQDARHKLVSSENVLVRSQDPVWTQIASGLRHVAFDGRTLTLRTTRVRSAINTSTSSSDGSRVAWQVYWVNGKYTPSDARAKAYTAFDKLLRRGDDGAAVVLMADDDAKGGADAALEAFLADHLGAIDSALQRAGASAGE